MAIAAVLVLAGCSRDAPFPGADPTEAASPPAERAAPARTDQIEFPGSDDRTVLGAWAKADRPKAAVLVVHTRRGLDDHIRSVARRLAGEGYSALAVDLLSEEGGTGAFDDPAEAGDALDAAPPERVVADIRAGLSELERRTGDARFGVVGFGFGGEQVWAMLEHGDDRVAAAVSFYGLVDDDPTFTDSEAAVLAIYAGQDGRVTASRQRAEDALARAGLPYRISVFEGARNGFFAESGRRFDAAASRDAWERVLDCLSTYVA